MFPKGQPRICNITYRKEIKRLQSRHLISTDMLAIDRKV